MSIRAVSWALSAKIGTTILCSRTKLVLVALAEYADNEKLQCWPNANMLAERLELSRRTVYRCIHKLVFLNLISYQKRRTKRGFNTSPLFTLLMPDIGTRGSKPSARAVAQPSATWLAPYNEPSLEPSLKRKFEFNETERKPSKEFLEWQKLRISK